MTNGEIVIVPQRLTGQNFGICPRNWILHQPNLIQIDHGKPVFRFTTIMSIFNPSFVEELELSYKVAKSIFLSTCPDLCELSQLQTRTFFLCDLRYFQIIDPGHRLHGFGESAEHPTLVSIFNPGITVSIGQTVTEIRDKMGSWTGSLSSPQSHRE